MRIATSTVYDNQTTSIDTLSAQYQSIGQDLSTGKSLNVPSDDPAQVSQDLTIRSTISAENSDASNASAAQNELTFTDTTLSSLTSVLQSARNLAVEGANDVIPNGAERPLIGKQVEGLLEQALGLANSQYGSEYIFAGTGARTQPPVTAQGSPPTGSPVISGNNDPRTELINGQTVQVGTTLQQAFNTASTDGTPSVFQVLATLRDTLDKEPAAVESQRPINVAGQVIYGKASPAPTTLGQISGPPPLTTIPLTADSAGGYAIHIDGTNPSTAALGSATISFTAATAVDSTVPPGVVQLINAQTATTGVTAAWNVASQRLSLTSTAPNSPPFQVSDAPTAGATNASNFIEAFQIPTQVSVTGNLSTQIGDIDDVIDQVLVGRAQLGQQLQNLAATGNQLAAQSTDNTTTKSTYEDTNIAAATSQFTLTQTALQAAYATTTRLEGKTLIDYL